MIPFALIVSIIFILLGAVHIYWAFYGIKNPEAVIPKKVTDKETTVPSKNLTFFVGLFLIMAALLFLNKTLNYLKYDGLVYAEIALGFLFLIRAVGDFKYVGFFKSIRDTLFARMDSRYYSPLCLLIALLIAFSQLLT
ncbi:DUF3995 domain-containing protein [Allomuricauda sp. SCSIO 65647]|uniref:DUF3995 domain-containing protein n=1 Tax=Allomuricauda sp. SCSIO 65647 TaxID=2908843 RepID=UPI001F3AD944|nr:DUF3995 domain-containing protein [Muricauda sp. SCSIO 65647]UJH66814.1 DUF3995 domain-containing protein [Muricauda sp. SCSIO 65647]